MYLVSYNKTDVLLFADSIIISEPAI